MTTPSYPRAAVAADHALASQAGLEVLRDGGNAVDAAVATSFALSIVRPYSCGIGGGGFMVLHLRDCPNAGATPDTPIATTINYRETCPRAVGPDYFETITDPDAPVRGGRAVCVPGHVAGMLYALEKYGTLSREAVLAPAIRLARAGYQADAHYEGQAKDAVAWIGKDQSRIKRFAFVWDRFLKQGNVRAGDTIALPEQGELLQEIARRGAPAFYEGPCARAIIDAVHDDSGELSPEDLANFRVQEAPPLLTRAAGSTFLCMPPPSSGGIVLAQVFAILHEREADLARIIKEHGHNSAPYIHLVAECCKHAFADRARWMGDADFVNVPLGTLLEPTYLASRARAIRLDQTNPQDTYGLALQPGDDHGTSHLCVVDPSGNAVACTETINLEFGSFTAAAPFAFCLNNTMDDFVTRTGEANAFGLSHGKRNRPAPGKRPLSSMTPTIVLKDSPTGPRPVMLAGGSGGPRIITATLQALLNMLRFDMDALAAVSAPRFHHQWSPHTLQLEDALMNTPVRGQLADLGHEVSRRQPVGAVQVIRTAREQWQPASDPRKGGAPAGI